MRVVKAKKHLGQHFLTDEGIAQKIGETLIHQDKYDGIVEVGPGMGMMTKYVKAAYPDHELKLIELDRDSVAYLGEHYSDIPVINEDFLGMNIKGLFDGQFAVIGNYPYNISSQIIFKVLENKEFIPEMTGMFQKEVAERICEGPGNKTYGVISVLIQAYYDAEYLFTVDEHVFNPPPKVKSGVLRLTRRDDPISCDHGAFRQVVKMSFNQRRKMLRKSLKSLFTSEQLTQEIFTKRPEQLSVDQFVGLVEMREDL